MHAKVSARVSKLRNTLLCGVSAIALLAAVPEPAAAQERGGFYVSAEGRYLFSLSDDHDISLEEAIVEGAVSVDPDDGLGGKLALGYIFRGPWDVRVSVSGGHLKSGGSLILLLRFL